MLQREGFKSLEGPYYNRESADEYGKNLKGRWATDNYRIIEFEDREDDDG